MLEDKIREVFVDMVVLKNPERSEYFSNLSIPSYMRDWLVMKFSDEDGIIDYDSVGRYIKRYIPGKEDFEQYKFQMVNGETVQFLARVRVTVDVKSGHTIFELPDFGGARGGAAGIVAYDVADKWKDTLLKESENWGILSLSWLMQGTEKNPKGTITMVNYKPFCPYSVDLDFYREARKNFDIHEWIDVIISAVDYNPDSYIDEHGEADETTKLFFLRRLLPFVEKRINLIELAPKGTGKSYVFEKISKRGWLISGGTVSRASLIYDNAKKMGGLLTRFDYVGFDEVQSITFDQPGQIQQAMKHYMEEGEIKGFDAMIRAHAGVIVLGNINAERFDVNKNMVEHISTVFGESATLDRFHGFIPGWRIPAFSTGMICKGWAINTEYFAEVMHSLREDISYAAIVNEMIVAPPKAYKRHMTAIKRMTTAFLKLLFPHVRSSDDISPDDFWKYCLKPAIEMRSDIYKQLCIIDPKEYTQADKLMPNLSCKGMEL
ncbi:BREX system Lon protease-like protein BrxL [Mitsuokella sp. oral taxon 131]|uniref:BREX system Lon protease-like protein BrxL n=1 Tax=Mitsuokella sp. oral taxon 131 TaxID=1321780 RepID=UPI000404422F|nr:BREX system Lon protease-like protein BrxL [Mitsuokella sp. oral taxon 131]